MAKEKTEISISKKRPMICDVLHEKFGVKWDDGVIVSIYPYIYCKYDLAPEKIVHEIVHMKRQEEMEPDIWWHKYLNEPSFRLEEEVMAYRKEAEFIRKNIKDRNFSSKFIHQMAVDLSGPMYGKMVNYSVALKLIRK